MLKKSLLFILIIAILPTTLAIETTLKENYQPGETLIAEISGNFIDNLKAEDISFYSGRLFVPLISNIAKIQDKYYLYALLPNKERNYTLIIKDAHYFEAGQEKKQDLEFNFSVSGTPALFSVNPGFIVTNKDFNIKVESKTKSLNLQTEFLGEKQEIPVLIGATKTLSFSPNVQEFTLTNLILEAEQLKYEVPVMLFKQESEMPESKYLRFSKSNLNFIVLKNQEFQFQVSLINTGQEDIEDISISTDLDIQVEPENIEKLSAGTSEKISFLVKSKETLKGKLQASSLKYTAEIPIYLQTVKNEEEFKTIIQEAEITEEESCLDLGGKFCVANEECEGISKLTIDSLGKLCCLGECKEEEKGYGKTIALIVILILLVIIGFFVYKKLKLRKQTSKEIIKEKSKEYEERFKPKEVRGSLSRV